MATDPDCDRVGVAVRDKDGRLHCCSPATKQGSCCWTTFCAQRTEHGTMPADPVVVKTIVTTRSGRAPLPGDYGVEVT